MLTEMISKQYRHPSGLLGFLIGYKMTRDHRPENGWTVSLLKAQPTDRILEIGFGAGMAIGALAQIVTQGKVVGVDYSKTMVRAAGWRNAQAVRSGRVELRQTEAANLPFEDGTFDKAFSIHSIYFWPQPLKALQEIRRVLKPEGMLIMTIMPKAAMSLLGPDAAVETAEFKPYGGEELAQLLGEAGFSATRIVVDSNSECRSNFSVIGVR
jgi:ubiquinone/menaquinone biosynthesis C-methylase UbiE